MREQQSHSEQEVYLKRQRDISPAELSTYQQISKRLNRYGIGGTIQVLREPPPMKVDPKVGYITEEQLKQDREAKTTILLPEDYEDLEILAKAVVKAQSLAYRHIPPGFLTATDMALIVGSAIEVGVDLLKAQRKRQQK